MMSNDYLNEVIRRGNELAALDQASLLFPKKESVARWLVAAAFTALVALFPSVCSAHAFFPII